MSRHGSGRSRLQEEVGSRQRVCCRRDRTEQLDAVLRWELGQGGSNEVRLTVIICVRAANLSAIFHNMGQARDEIMAKLR